MALDLPESSPKPGGGATRIVFIVGEPVAQTKAPAALAGRLRERGTELVIVPARVAANDFARFVAALERMGDAVGLIVTGPHQFVARRLCAEVDPLADRVGSVNLMRRHPTSGWFGTMTEGEGCIHGLRARGFSPAGKRALLVGAGGSGIAVADALVRAGVAELRVHDVVVERARHLIDRMEIRPGLTVATASADPTGFDLVVNVTLTGNAPGDLPPVDPQRLTPRTAVADLAGSPGGQTALVRSAANIGCVTMSGEELFDAMGELLADFFLYDSADGLAASSLHQLLNGYRVTQAIHVAAVLGVADHLSTTPIAVDRLAEKVGADHATLYRLLRALAALGVFREENDRTFSIAPMGAWLRSDAEPSVRAWAMFLAHPSRWEAWGNLLHSLRTGESAFRFVHGMDSWEYGRRHPEQASLFQVAMTANSQRIDRAVVAACDVTGCRHLGDVGGGRGSLLAAFLEAHPNLCGTLFDQPDVVNGARETIDRAGLLGRCRIVGGDMFAEVPRGCDSLVMKFILHDWNDDEAMSILRSCRRAVDDGSRLFVVEYLLEPPNEGLHAKMSDLNMLVGPGGRERTADEYEALLRGAGFSLASVIPTAARVSILAASAC